MVFGRYSEAQKAWNRALEIGEMIYGPDGPQYDHVLVHFAQGSALFGDYASAEKMFRKYLAIEGDNNSGTPEYAVVAGELARIDTQLHRYAEAQSWFAAATGIMDRNPESAPLVRSTILCYLGDYYMARGDWSNAQARYSEALRIQQSVLGENRAVAVSMIALSKALKKLHLKDQARNLMARAKTILSSHTDPLQQATVDVMALRRQ
jgi:tetratricopeptide (TPR) repeat protein